MTYFLDERIILPFHRVNETGVYRYNVYKGDELIFVGNIYCVANNKDVQIDITDVARRYYQNQIPFSETPEESPVLTTFNVEFFGDQTEIVSQDVYMIYRQPNFNSDVTEDIGINEFPTNHPMLQGYEYFLRNYHLKKDLFPTYPAVITDKLTFDSVYNITGSAKFNQYIETRYNGGYSFTNYSSDNLNPNNGYDAGGMYQFSVPLSQLLQLQTNTINKYEDFDNYLKYNSGCSGWGGKTETANNNGEIVRVYSGERFFTSGMDSITLESNFDGMTSTLDLLIPLEETDTYMSWTMSKYYINKPSSIRFLFKGDNILRCAIEFKPLEDYADNFGIEFLFTYDKTSQILKLLLCTYIKENYTFTPCDVIDLREMTLRYNEDGTVSSDTGNVIAKFDKKSRYFLKWRDRYGMSQIQPFKGTYLYSENISRNKIINYKNTSKLVDSTNQGKWMINTDWISQDLYPFYESIFVSPWLQLYDAKEDKLYNVILSNTEYDEKTFNNQNRQLFNLQLEVELDTTQNIIY